LIDLDAAGLQRSPAAATARPTNLARGRPAGSQLHGPTGRQQGRQSPRGRISSNRPMAAGDLR